MRRWALLAPLAVSAAECGADGPDGAVLMCRDGQCRDELYVQPRETCSVIGGLCMDDCTVRRTSTGPMPCDCEVGAWLHGHSELQRTAIQNSGSPTALLRQTPFLMTHDSATGLIGMLDGRNLFAQAQTIGLSEQLTCGARALDLRLVRSEDSSEIYFHHSSESLHWVSDQSLQGEWPKMMAWAKERPEELVVLVMSHCQMAPGTWGWRSYFQRWTGLECSNPFYTAEFQKLGIPWQADCERVSAMTHAEAKQMSRLKSGGHILAVDGACIASNWDSSVNEGARVRPYVERTMSKMRNSAKMPFMVQSFIQQRLTVPMSTPLNQQVLSEITTSDLYAGVNFLEINLICAYGTSMAIALGYTTISSQDFQSCRSSCRLACKRHGACEQL
ncbi:unnamed protein product [Durusdinium trenchii]|uniref:PLC-like phosphodiesterase n=1 Tax=Durusdinium trenchii TaxID=1381693 RepID=A0ABP0RZR9_9DINO